VTGSESNIRSTAVVVGLVRRADGVSLAARRHTGDTVEVAFPALPDTAAGSRDATAVRRPLAVLISGARPHDCVVLGTSRRGPLRRHVSLGSALALCESGVHTVLTLVRPST
jgi:hypothetical protein